MTDEEQYFETRAEQWEHSHRLSRAQLLKLGAAVPLLAGASRLLPADVASAARLADPPIRKPLPPEWFVPFGTNAEMRWDSVAGLGYTTPNERFFVRNHTSTPVIDPATWRLRVFGSGLAGGDTEFTYQQLRKLPVALDDRLHRVRRQRTQLLRQPAGTPRVAGRSGRSERSASPRGAACSCPKLLERAGIKPSAVDVLPEGLDANVVTRRRRPGTRPPAATRLEGARRRADRVRDERRAASVRPRLSGPARRARLDRDRQHQVARPDRGLRPAALLAVEHAPPTAWSAATTRPTPRRSRPRSSRSAFELARGAELPADRKVTLDGRSWSGTGSIRRVEVSIDRGATWGEAGVYGKNAPEAWARWTFRLPRLAPGPYELWARATDETGRVQPLTRAVQLERVPLRRRRPPPDRGSGLAH